MKAAMRPASSESAPSTLPNGRPRVYRAQRTPFAGIKQAIALESSVKLTVNIILSVIAATTIAKLVPYYQTQQARLDVLQTSVESAERRNASLREDFARNFDPTQASVIMQEQSGRVAPNQKRIVWTEPLDADRSANPPSAGE